MNDASSTETCVTHRIRHPEARGVNRQAVILVAVIVCLIVCTLLIGSLMRSIVAFHRQSEMFERSLQSACLADAGVQRAMARLQQDPDYRGEQWVTAATSLGQAWSATVTISVQPLADQGETRRIRVESHYPLNPQLRVVCTREVIVSAIGGGES